MIKFNTKQLLKILPLDETVRKNALDTFDNLSEDQKLEIKKICWLMFFQLLSGNTRYEFEKALQDIKNKTRDKKLSSKFRQEIEDEALQKLKTLLLEKTEQAEVEEVREELQRHLRQPAEKPASAPTPSPSPTQ